MPLFLRLCRQFPISGLDVLLLQRCGPGHVVQLVVETAGVADRFPVGVPPPERGGRGVAVRTAGALPLSRRLKNNNS